MSDSRGKGRGEDRRGGRSMSVPLSRLSAPPMQCPPAASTVSSPPLPINYASSHKSPPSLASPSSSMSASASASDLCVCTPYIAVAIPLIPVLAVIMIVRPPCNYCRRTRPFSYLVMSSVTCVHFIPEATERLVQQKNLVGKPSSLGQSTRS